MRKELLEKVNMFKVFNDITLKDEIVIFGSSFAADFPFYELSQKYMLSNAIYNRSVRGLTLAEAIDCVNDCVLAIRPHKLFLNLGENDLDNPDAIKLYEKLIIKIKEKLPHSQIYIMPIHNLSPGAELFNRKLTELSIKTNTHYLKLSYSNQNENSAYSRMFKQMSCFFRKTPIRFTDAFGISR